MIMVMRREIGKKGTEKDATSRERERGLERRVTREI